jgi:integrase/recombinase XerD
MPPALYISLSRLSSCTEQELFCYTALMNTVIAPNNPEMGNVQEIAAHIAHSASMLKDLTPDQLEQIAKLVITQRLTQELDTAAYLAGIDYQQEKELFLQHAGREGSINTQKGYRAALKRLEQYAARIHINVLELSPTKADDFIYTLKGEGRASASVRRDVAAASSFFTFLERRHANIHNPFRGTRARPARRAFKKIEIPTPEEIETILLAMPSIERASITIMVLRGLRVGSLPALIIKGKRFETRSKGKDLTGEIPEPALEAIKADTARMNPRKPFARLTINAIEKRIQYQVGKLYKTGKISALYSSHDFRHYFSVQEYRKNKDIYRLSKLLGHTSLQTTESYLKALGEIDT